MPAATVPVSLRPITADNVLDVARLAVADSQKDFLASNAVSLAEAPFTPEAWCRAIHAGEDLAGFVMLYDESNRTPPPARPAIEVWRFMVDQRFQGRGIGRAALEQVIDHARSRPGCATLELSYLPGPGCPEPFYRRLGFRPTGRVDDGEVVLALPLAPVAVDPVRTASTTPTHDPAGFAQRQLDAYNARDLARFIAEYTDDVLVYQLPGAEPVLSGKAAFAEHYRTRRFNLPGLRAELVQRMVFGNKVIDQERVFGVQATAMEAAAIYETTPAGIAKVWFVGGE